MHVSKTLRRVPLGAEAHACTRNSRTMFAAASVVRGTTTHSSRSTSQSIDSAGIPDMFRVQSIFIYLHAFINTREYSLSRRSRRIVCVAHYLPDCGGSINVITSAPKMPLAALISRERARARQFSAAPMRAETGYGDCGGAKPSATTSARVRELSVLNHI